MITALHYIYVLQKQDILHVHIHKILHIQSQMQIIRKKMHLFNSFSLFLGTRLVFVFQKYKTKNQRILDDFMQNIHKIQENIFCKFT